MGMRINQARQARMVREINDLAASRSSGIFLNFTHALTLNGNQNIALDLAALWLHQSTTANVTAHDWGFKVLLLSCCGGSQDQAGGEDSEPFHQYTSFISTL